MASKVFSFIIIIIFIGIIVYTGYFLYLNIPRAPEKLEVNVPILQETHEQEVFEIKQFYSNMKFNHNKISYFIDNNCNSVKRNRMIHAFEGLEEKVSIISFYEKKENHDILVSCSENIQERELEEKHFVAGEGGAKTIIPTGRYNIINDGVILLYDNNEIKIVECEYPNVELHELMHVLGFEHSNNKKSLMYPFIESCDQILDDSIVEQLKKIYSQSNLADLYFENVNLIKKGRYLDFDITIKNSGSVDSDDVIITILDDDKIVDENNIGKIKFGAGITLETQNFKLINLNPEKISFVIDKENKIKEIDEKNNIANVEL